MRNPWRFGFARPILMASSVVLLTATALAQVVWDESRLCLAAWDERGTLLGVDVEGGGPATLAPAGSIRVAA